MDWLNYHHLYYFWTVARSGSITAASVELSLAPPTLSAQIHNLEDNLGEKLFRRVGRNLVLTDKGTVVFRLATEIFELGREIRHAITNSNGHHPMRLAVGIADVVPSLIAEWLIEPALLLASPVRLLCREAAAEQLLAKLAIGEIDLVLSDAPASPNVRIRAYNHLLAECGTTLVTSPKTAEKYQQHFPDSLDGAPMLLPTDNTVIRRSLDTWFEERNIRPKIVGEFEDYSLLRAFGETGHGIFPAPSVLQKRIRRLFGLNAIGRIDAVQHRFYAISIEKKINHPAIAAICEGKSRLKMLA